MQQNVELTTKEEELLERYREVFTILLNQKSKNRAARIIATQFGYNSVTQAYRDLKAAEDIFGKVNETDKQILRQIATEMAIEAYEIAKATKNLPEMNKALANMIKANGLEREDVDLPDFGKLMMPKVEITLTPEFLEKYGHKIDPKLLEQLKAKLQEAKITPIIGNIIDITHEELQ